MKSGKLSVALVACIHGDEVAGIRVFKELKKNNALRNKVGFFVAHPQALRQRKRFITADLNRSFPGSRTGTLEERIAYKLRRKLKSFDIVLDIHTTNSGIDRLAIVTSLSPAVKNILKFIPIEKVAIVPRGVFGGKELIRYHRAGVSLEYGPNKSGKNYRKIVSDINVLFRNLGILPKHQHGFFLHKELYRVRGIYRLQDGVRPERKLRDFSPIREGQAIGKTREGTIVQSNRSFYPLFLGKGRYPKTFALISSKEKLLLKK